MTTPSTLLCAFFLVMSSVPALADTHAEWEPEVTKATDGLMACMAAHEETLSGRLAEYEKRILRKETKQQCEAAKASFDTALLSLRSRHKGVDSGLADYQQKVGAIFGIVKPGPDVNRYSYTAYEQKIRDDVAEAKRALLKAAPVEQ